MKIVNINQRSALGFTLIELIVIVAVVATLLGLLLPAFANARSKATQARCINNERQIGMYTQSYLADHQDQFPDFSLANAWWEYLDITDRSTITCPNYFVPSEEAAEIFNFGGSRVHFAYGLNAWGPAVTGVPQASLGFMPNPWGPIRCGDIALPTHFVESTESLLAVMNAVRGDNTKPNYLDLFVPAMPTTLGTTPSIGPGHHGRNNVLCVAGNVLQESVNELVTNTTTAKAFWSSDALPHTNLWQE